MARVIVALSGGVDSAVSAALLLDAGHQVEALFMSNWVEDDEGYCTTAEDFQDARRVADELGIAIHKASFAPEYRERVFAHFLAELEAGRTPNPDVLCNREVKFGVGLDYARRLGAERYATGHYARIGPGGRLLRGVDRAKDQSYFLHSLDAAQLSFCEFPVGGLRKPEVRAIARERGLPVAGKRDSTGICFIGERPFGDFIGAWLPARPGAIETVDGAVIGQHRGLERYTLGQRSGLGVGGLRRRRRSSLVRRRQGPAAERPGCRSGQRPSLAALRRPSRGAAALDFGCGTFCIVQLHGEGALPAAGCRLPRRARS